MDGAQETHHHRTPNAQSTLAEQDHQTELLWPSAHANNERTNPLLLLPAAHVCVRLIKEESTSHSQLSDSRRPLNGTLLRYVRRRNSFEATTYK